MHVIMSTGLLTYVECGRSRAVQLMGIPVVYIHSKMKHLAPFVGEGGPYDYWIIRGDAADIIEVQVGGDAGGDIHI